MKLTLTTMNISEVQPHTRNVKHHGEKDLALLAESIDRFGFNDPIAVDENGVIVEGVGRYEAAAILGIDTLPVIVIAGMTAKDIALYRIAHNKIALLTSFDFNKLVDVLSGLVGDEISFASLGFSDEVADNLLRHSGAEMNDEPVSIPVEAFEIVWASPQEKKDWDAFVKLAENRFGAKGSDAVLQAITNSGVLDGIRIDEKTAYEVEEL